MKKITFIFSLMVAMFTTAMAQTNVDLTTGTFDGVYGLKDTMSKWTSTEGIEFVTTDAHGNEIGVMKYYNEEFRFNINTEDVEGNPIAMPIGITITAPEGYILKEIAIKDGGKYNSSIEYYSESYSLSTETVITLDETVANFTLSGTPFRYVILKSLTVVRDGNAEGGETEGGETEGEGNENQGGNEGEIEGGDNQGGNEGEGEGEGNEEEGEDIIDRGEGNENQGGNEGETEGEGNENQGGNEGEIEGGVTEGEGNEGNEDIEGGKEEGDNEGEEASIDEVTVETAKVIYDLTGRRVNEITKAGIYIVHGKKVVIK